MPPRTVYVGVDIGSVNRPGGFSWVLLDGDQVEDGQDDPSELADRVVTALADEHCVAMAFESPLSVPVPSVSGSGSDGAPVWKALGRGRAGDGNRPWSAGAGAGALATGLVQVAWVCAAVAVRIPGLRATTRPEFLGVGGCRLLLAEAMVTGVGKPTAVPRGQDHADAMAAAHRLRELLTTGTPSDVSSAPHRPFNLAAAAALHAGLDLDPSELHGEVLVARARPVTSLAPVRDDVAHP